MAARHAAADTSGMTPHAPAPTSPRPARLTQAEHDALAAELHERRSRRREELAQRLRDARDHGSPGDNDDVLSVLEEVSVEEARIAELEDLLRAAPAAAPTVDGAATVGCAVSVADDRGRSVRYRLVGRRGDDAGRHDVTPGSPVGRALIGAVPGDRVRVELPDGRVRELRVQQVAPDGIPGRRVA